MAHNEKVLGKVRLVVALFVGIAAAVYGISGLWLLVAYAGGYLGVAGLLAGARMGGQPQAYFKSRVTPFERGLGGLLPFFVTWLLAQNVAALF